MLRTVNVDNYMLYGGGSMWELIQKILNEQNISVNQLSERIGFKSNSVLYALKNGKINKPSFELMEKIADGLNVSLDEFRNKN